MKFNELQVRKKQSPKRVGRGISAGQGKTAGRGTKGQNSRTGGGTRPGFEGGQNPLTQRLPKLRGFKSKRAKVENVYTGQLSLVEGTTIDNYNLAQAGLVKNPYSTVKLIVKGELTGKYEVKLQSASATAIEAIQKAGGSFKAVPRAQRTAIEKAEATK
jgi:large subunit ribosomal protein L15